MQELCPLFIVATQARIAWCFTVQLYAEGHRLAGDRRVRKVPVGGDMGPACR